MKYESRLDNFMRKQPEALLVCASAALVAAITIVDLIVGQHFSSALFYTIPVMAAGWWARRPVAIAVSVLSSVGMLITDWVFADGGYPLVGLWNAVFPFFFFIFLVLLLSALRASLEREEALSRTDPLTGLLNRRHFQELATLELSRAERYAHPLALAFIDLDNFKQVNDTMGHEEGDEVLTGIASIFKADMRASDLIARFGGDEFAILLPETGLEDALDAVNRIRSDLSAMAARKRWPVTLSIGLVCFTGPPPDLQEMIREADTLMYEVKESGKDRVESRTVDSGPRTAETGAAS